MDPIFWSIILLAAGACVVFMELFVPSAGVLAVIAATLVLSGVIVAYFSSFTAGLIITIATSIAIPFLIALAIKVWPSTPIGRRILIGRMTEDDVLPTGEQYEGLKDLVGRVGIARTKMLPSGLIRIDDQSYDAISDGFAIEPGQKVEVTAIRTNKILVRPYDESVAAETPESPDDILSRPIEDLGIDLSDENET